MTRILPITLLALLLLVLSGCRKDHEELFTEATIEIDLTDLNIQEMQGTAKLRNINTLQEYTSAQEQGGVYHFQVLRGAYQITIEGRIKYMDEDEETHIKNFICYTDYADFSHESGNHVKLKITLR